MDKKIDVLDKGHVRLINHMGDDLDVVNAARASFDKRSEREFYCIKCGQVWPCKAPEGVIHIAQMGSRLAEKDRKLIRYLVGHGHMSPFRHGVLSFEVKAPLMVARQWWKYRIASAHAEEQDGWNEASRRYVTSEPEFYIPDEWRLAPENKKQGSGGPVEDWLSSQMKDKLYYVTEIGLNAYRWALEHGVCAEQARGFLPANFQYVTWRWTVSLEGVSHMLDQRLKHDAQWEFQEYARAVRTLAYPLFPVSLAVLLGEEG